MEKIGMDKKYKTRSGLDITILKTDVKNEFPVLALVIYENGEEEAVSYTAEGTFFTSKGAISDYDLVEVNPWDDFKIDDPVIVSDGDTKYRRHFAGVINGIPYAWDDGKTSFTTTDRSSLKKYSIVKFYY